MPRQSRCAQLQDFLLEALGCVGTFIRAQVGNDIERDYRSDKPAVACRSATHSDRRVDADNRFDFLRMNFQAADVYHSVLSSDKVISIAVKLYHVCGIDKALVVKQSRRTDPNVLTRCPV